MPDALPFLRKVEVGFAISLSAIAAWLYLAAARAAGGLWRDEANTVGLATLPELSDVWSNLQYDSFPILWVLIVRSIAAVFGEMNDPAFRVTGFIIGLLVISALWTGARAFGHRLPLAALALFAMAPSVSRWGISFRGYGLGMVLGILACACIWRFADRGGRNRFVLAGAVSVISVHVLYYNATVVLAACAGGMVVCALARERMRALAVLGLGVAAAVSLTPYRVIIRNASSWNSLVELPDYNFMWFIAKLAETLNPAGSWALPTWLGIFVLAVWAGIRETARGNRLGLSATERRLVIFATIALIVGAVTNFVFLKVLSYVTQPWYYLTLVAITAICIDALSGALIRSHAARITRLVVVTGIAVLTITSTRSPSVRMTNADIVAAQLATIAEPGDMIVLHPWYSAVSFSRYYEGGSRWTTIPEIAFHRFHRYDLFALAMQAPDQRTPAEPILREAFRVLQGGGAVFVVGGLPPAGSRADSVLSPARIPEDGNQYPRYQDQWGAMLGLFLRSNAGTISVVPPPANGPISDYENLTILIARGSPGGNRQNGTNSGNSTANE